MFKRIFTVVLLSLGSFASVANDQLKVTEIPTVERVQLDRYLGQWFAVAIKRSGFQRLCYSTTRAQYGMLEDNLISVKNECTPYLSSVFPETSIEGTAKVVDASTNAQLAVSFRGRKVEDANYFIVGLDGNPGPDLYQWVVVASSDKNLIWAMVRDPSQASKYFKDFSEVIQKLSENSCDLRLEPQVNADYAAPGKLCDVIR